MAGNDEKLRRLKFRAWHRGTREADFMMGGFFDAHSAQWGEAEVQWFENLLVHDDVDIMAWVVGKQPVPQKFQGDLMAAMQKLDYIEIPGWKKD